MGRARADLRQAGVGVKHHLTHLSPCAANQTVTPRRATAPPSLCYQCGRVWPHGCECWREPMDANNVRSGHLGPIVVMAVVPIVIYMLVWLLLPWIGKW